MRFPVGTKKIDDIPELAELESVKILDPSKRDKIVRYICFCYDYSSELVRMYPNLLKRKRAALEKAGFTKTDSKFTDGLVNMTNETILNVANEILKILNHREWALIVLHEETFNEYQHRILTRVDAEKDKEELQALEVKNKLLKSCHEINERLKQYYRDLYSDDISLISENDKRLKRYSPEAISKR